MSARSGNDVTNQKCLRRDGKLAGDVRMTASYRAIFNAPDEAVILAVCVYMVLNMNYIKHHVQSLED